jgi:hypothetical protein
MNYTNRIPLLVLVCCAISSAFGFDDQGFRFITNEVSQESVAGRLNGAFTSSDADVASGVFDPRAEKLLGSAQTFTKAVFNLPSVELVKATTEG